MDAYHHQRRFAGSGDAPPPPHPSHPNAHWYPAPPPPYPPHPSLPYPPQHHQWGPPPNVQHQRHPPPPPPQQQQTYAYQPPPPAPGNPWPPHHAAGQPPPPSYPPPPPPLPGQAWTNHSWAQNHGYPDHGNEEDWATKAKAWAAATMSTIRTENHHYGHHDQYQQPAGLPTEVTEPLHPPVPQSSNDHVPFPMTGQHRETNHLLDRGPVVSPARNFGSFPSTYELEVSYNYSSAPGNGNAMLQYPSSQAQPFPTASSVQDGFTWAPPSMLVAPSVEQPPFGHERQSVDPSDQPLEFNSRKAPDMAVHMNFNSTIPSAPTVASNHDVVATSTHSWMPSGTAGFLPRAPVPPQAAQMDPSVHAAPLFGAVSGSNYVPPAAFGVGNVAEVFPTDPNTPFNVAEKSKKPPVPNWLREELLKKKSAPLSTSAQHSANLNSMESNDAEQPLRKPDQSDSRSNDSAKSTEDDEDEIEPARTAAINQEIKRVLTEVLLKVTDDLFYEIATKVLNEDDSSVESNEPTGSFGSKEPDLGESKTKTLAIVVLPVKPANISSIDSKGSTGLSSPKGALLSLASYDSDDDNSDGDNKIHVPNLSSETNAGTANPEEGGKGGNHNENKNSLGNTSSWEDLKSINKKNQRSTNAEHEREHIHDTENGEFPLDAKPVIQPKGAIHKMGAKADRYEEVDIQSRKASSDHHTEKYNDVESSHRHLEKSSKDNFFKEMKADHTKELEPSTAEKYNNDDKYSIYGNVDKKGSFKEEKGYGRIAKHESDTREPHSRGNSKQDDAKGDQKDARERNRDTTYRRGKGTDEKDRSRQMTKSSTSHSSRRSQSRSPRGRSQTRKESSSHVRGSVSSDEPSDSVKKRKLHSCKNSMSPSPPKSRKRRVSRSPHSKHSHRKHSPYSSADRKRWSRSISPVKRR